MRDNATGNKSSCDVFDVIERRLIASEAKESERAREKERTEQEYRVKERQIKRMREK